MFLCLILTHKVSPTQNSETTAVQVLSCGQAQPTARGEVSWTVALSWARKIKSCKLLTPASSNIKVIQLSAKLFFTRNHAARKTSTQADNRSWVSTVRDSYSRQLQNHTQLELENSVFNSMQNTKTQEFTWSDTLFWSLRQTGHPNLKSNHRAAMERESNQRHKKTVKTSHIRKSESQ